MTIVITKGYGVRATTIEGRNAFAPSLCFAYSLRSKRFLLSSQLSRRTRAETLAMQVTLRKSHATNSQNTRDQITSDGRSKRSWSDLRSVHFIPFILNERLNECC